MVHETAFSMPAVVRKSLAATMFERNTMLKTLKRKIALVAVAALGAGGLAVIAAPAANAVDSTAISAAAPAVRVSFTNTTLDAVGLVPMTILLKTNGVHVTTAQKLLGHASPMVTLSIYTKVLDQETLETGAKLSQSLGLL